MNIRDALLRVLTLAEDNLNGRQCDNADSEAVKMIGRLMGNKHSQVDCSVLFIDEIDDSDDTASLNVGHQNPKMEDDQLLKEGDLIAEMIRSGSIDMATDHGLCDVTEGIISKRIVITFQEEIGEA